MTIDTSERNLLNNPRMPPKSILEHFSPGTRIRLRKDVYRYIKDREWILNRIEGNEVHLLHESRLYGLIVKMEDIDWDYQSIIKGEKNYAQERKG
jgi:hypothetical protein